MLPQSLNCILDMEETNDAVDEQNEAKEAQVNIPQDAQGIIISFLPGRVVVKLRRVCKFWRDIVMEPSFVDRHLSNSLRFHESIACFTSVADGLAHMYTFDPISMNFKSVELLLSDRFNMSGPCNGLVCTYDFEGNAEVLNPTIQRYLSLPDSEIQSLFLSSEYFLGFVDSTKEYKVVSVRHHMVFLIFEIWTIGTLSWRTVHLSEELLKTTRAVIVNDAMYWLVLEEASTVLCQEILMLDLIDEDFWEVPLPDAAKQHDLALLEGEGMLHLLSTPVDGSTVSNIWVLNLTQKIWVPLPIVAPRVPAGMSLFVLRNMRIFCGRQDTLWCVDLLDGTVSYIDMPSEESLICCGKFVESFAPTVTQLTGFGVLGRSSDHIGWSTADLEQSQERAKRTTNMEWKMSGGGFVYT